VSTDSVVTSIKHSTSASIKWFGNEQEIQTRHGWSDPQLS
jgi:hypothetical protein